MGIFKLRQIIVNQYGFVEFKDSLSLLEEIFGYILGSFQRKKGELENVRKPLMKDSCTRGRHLREMFLLGLGHSPHCFRIQYYAFT